MPSSPTKNKMRPEMRNSWYAELSGVHYKMGQWWVPEREENGIQLYRGSEERPMRDKELAVRDGLSYMTYAPVVFLSALTGQRVDKLYQLINEVANQSTMRVTTGMLNNILEDATARVQPPTDKGRRLKIYYMTQVGVKPPHFVAFCNDARLFHFSYQRYLENQLRAVFGLMGTPIKLTIRQKGDKED